MSAVAVLALAVVSGCGFDPGAVGERIGSHAYLRSADAALEHPTATLVRGPCTPEKAADTRVDAAARQKDMDALSLPSWRSGDVGVTTPLSDGRVLWVFGDTVRAPGATPRVVGNSMMVERGRCFDEVRPQGGGAVIGGFAGRRVCWPGSALTVPMHGADIVVVGCSRVDPGHGGLMDFTYAGWTLSTFVVARGGAPQKVTQTDVIADDDDPSRINWGAAMAEQDGWVYVYGSQQPQGSLAKGAYVARTRLADLNEHSRWRFWNGTRFVEGASNARAFLAASQGVSQTFSVARWHGRFLLVSKQGGEFGPNVGVWSAPTPHGPWSGLKAVPEPYDQGRGVVAYQPLAHPELLTPQGDLLLTMSRTTVRFADLIAHPSWGRPKFLQVPVD